MEEIIRTDIDTEEELDREILKISKANPAKYVTYAARIGKVWIFLHDKKPQNGTTGGAEYTYRQHGGFFKNGAIVKPSSTFVKRFHFCPVSR